MPEIVVMTPRWEKGDEVGWQCATVVERITSDAYVVRFDDGHEAGAFQSRMLCGPVDGKAIVEMAVTAWSNVETLPAPHRMAFPPEEASKPRVSE